MEQSIFIVLADNASGFEGKKHVTTVDKNVVADLNELVNRSISFNRIAEKLTGKKDQMYRHSQKLMKRIIVSHRVPVDFTTEAVGIGKETNTIYVGPKDDVAKDPAAEPQEGYVTKGSLTKSEKRKYDELLSSFQVLNQRIVAHNIDVQKNEEKMVDFEKEILVDEEYDKKAHILVVLVDTGEVILCDNPDYNDAQ